MSKATCRCGERLTVPRDGTDRTVCPKCGARVRLRKPVSAAAAGGGEGVSPDGFVRFSCPCGRRLKVKAGIHSTHGKCPDCGRVVSIPGDSDSLPPAHPSSPTVDLSANQISELDKWSREWKLRQVKSDEQFTPVTAQQPLVPVERAEAGFRICPKCLKPVHLGSEVCRQCGTQVPRP